MTKRVSLARVAAALAVMASAALVYANALRHPPIWDDHVFVFGQEFARRCENLGRVLAPSAFTEVLAARGSARPVWLASVIADACLGGAMPVYRLTSLFWHAAGAAVLMALASALGASPFAAAAAGLLFAVHPVHAEAVNIVTFRSDLLCFAFMTGAVLLCRLGGPRRGRRAAPFYAGALALAAAALLSKETAAALPALVWLCDAFFPEGAAPRRRRLAVLVAGSALVAAYLVFRAPRSGYAMRGGSDLFTSVHKTVDLPFSRGQSGARALPTDLDDPPWKRVYTDPAARFWTMARVFGDYLRLLAWPARLQGEYAPRVLTRPTPAAAASLAAWALLLGAAWRLRRRAPLAAFGVWWTAAALLPVTGVVALRNLEGERYLYAASAGVCLAAGALLGAAWSSRQRNRRAAAAAVLAVLAVAGAARTWARNGDFSSDARFYRAAVAADPDVPSARLALGQLAAEAGDDAQAEIHLSAACALWPDSSKARLAHARFLLERGRSVEAVAQLDAAASSAAPAAVRLRLGRAYWAAGRSARARAELEAAAAQPDLWEAREALGVLSLEQGRLREARALLESAAAESQGGSALADYHLAVLDRREGKPGWRARRARLERRDPRLAARLGARAPDVVRPGP